MVDWSILFDLAALEVFSFMVFEVDVVSVVVATENVVAIDDVEVGVVSAVLAVFEVSVMVEVRSVAAIEFVVWALVITNDVVVASEFSKHSSRVS